jgi:lipid A ethanolaminephosphotransferase
VVSLFTALACNRAFFSRILDAYGLSPGSLLPLLSTFIVLVCAQQIFLGLFSFRRVVKPALCAFLLLAAVIRYFSDSYGLVVDESMLNNILKTDQAEALDLLNWGFVQSLLVFGVVPSVLVWKTRLIRSSLSKELLRVLVSVCLCLVVALVSVLVFSKFYASFFREHKSVRSYANPLYSLYSVGKLAAGRVGESGVLVALGRDSAVPASDVHRELVILVVGETARADRFSLNGYSRETNPLLKKEKVISFPDVWACGTSTATSVPCMFSSFGRAGYSDQKARHTENLLDIMQNTKRISVLWRDNNSDSKGVADRVPSQDFKTSATNPACDVECRDVGMLSGLQEYIDGQKGDILIVLHQMGNHGPAYFKRYPEGFSKFEPACRSNELEKCSLEEIGNAYDNAILYTDYFLSEVIAFLKRNSGKYEAGMVYVSDHGESLGESGIFLHGLPYLIAPEAQKKVPMIVWMSDSLAADHPYEELKARAAGEFSHDNLFHSLLGLFEVESSVYRKELDLFSGGQEHP